MTAYERGRPSCARVRRVEDDSLLVLPTLAGDAVVLLARSL